MVNLKKKIKSNDNAFLILFMAIIFASVILLLNYVVYVFPTGNDANIETMSGGDVKGDSLIDKILYKINPLNLIEWIITSGEMNQDDQQIGIWDMISLDVHITKTDNTGFLGLLIRAIYGLLIVVGLVEILWIG